MASDERCETCRFWKRQIKNTGLQPTTRGQCRVNHPRIIENNPTYLGYFPLIEESDWCGEYQRKEAETQ